MKPVKHWLEENLTSIWFGSRQPNFVVAALLQLLSWVYAALRFASSQHAKSIVSRKPTRPLVLVVGNLVAGGAGKTPVVQATCQALKDRGIAVGILTRGYGRKSNSPSILKPGDSPNAAECGDEPVWLHQQTQCPIAVGSDRAAALSSLTQAFPNLQVIVSDDGLQHHRLSRTIEWVVFDDRAAGNGKLIPAGPLREPLSRLDRIDAVLTHALSQDDLEVRLGHSLSGLYSRIKLTLTGFKNHSTSEFLALADAQKRWQSLDLVAFTGLGNPNKFFHALRDQSIFPDRTLCLPDHFDYPPEFRNTLPEALAITTGKDAVKLKPCATLWVACIHMEIPDELIDSITAQLRPPSH